jgi:hypothetical protein
MERKSANSGVILAGLMRLAEITDRVHGARETGGTNSATRNRPIHAKVADGIHRPASAANHVVIATSTIR